MPLNKSQYVGSKQAADLVPDTMPVAQSATISVGDPGRDSYSGAPILGQYDPAKNAIVTQPGQRSAPDTIGHELAHGIWRQDLPLSAKAQWYWLHAKDAMGASPSLPVRNYPDDPSHSFAAAYGWYMDSPGQMKESAPDMYNFMMKHTGMEYAGAGPTGTQGSMDNPVLERQATQRQQAESFMRGNR